MSDTIERLITVHDNVLLRYSVDGEARTIVIETVHRHATPPEYANIIFVGVVVYWFENDVLESGTIIFNVEHYPNIGFVNDQWSHFEAGRKWGWPGSWAETPESAIAYLEANELYAYNVNSSLGLSGWVLAKSMKIEPGVPILIPAKSDPIMAV